ncbi:uncharacterized protein LOC132906818 isoform X2 [Bombus pascuorum]|uniref:uncharacterized protein LOC132906818 isoform X2 n=1 Tax=Bombus pascuorum TaxID=65598 RepID=UPI00298EC9F7|nr:uncharacterized protein LOC132906818 isoform X2 [Bombus pascuorum]
MTIRFVTEDSQKFKEDHLSGKRDGTESEKVKFERSRDLTSGSTGTTGGSSNKRAKKKRREIQQEFTHSWMVGVLKGHTGTVLNMNFSSNGRYLASCAEDCGLGPEQEMLDVGETNRYDNCQANHETPGSTEGTLSRSNNSSPSSTSALMTSTASGGQSATSDEANSTTTPSPTKEDQAILSRWHRTRTQQLRDDEHKDKQSNQEKQRHCLQIHCLQSVIPETNFIARNTSCSRRIQIHCLDSVIPETNFIARNTSCSRVIQIQTDSHNEGNRNDRELGNCTKRKELQHFSDAVLASMLRKYALSGEQLADLGYPVEYSYPLSFPCYAVIINHYYHLMGHRVRDGYHRTRGYHRLDVNAREFVPGGKNFKWPTENGGDSGHCTGSSVENSDLEQESASDSDKNSDISETSDFSYSSSPKDESSRNSSVLAVDERLCARCHKIFYQNQDDSEYLSHEPCVYHWGKLRNRLIGGTRYDIWECCRERGNAQGCTIARMHVWTGLRPGFNGPFGGYVRTNLAQEVPADGNYGVYALDCEMCFTLRGLELVKVTVVDIDGRVVYDTLVKPDVEVIDYNTRFSGITAKDLETVTKTIRDVQRDLTSFIYAQTILIGHGLENDLRALKLIHTTVVDTCVAFPHFLGYPYRNSLKTLARTVLYREIQAKAHDSVEDARIVMDLMLRKLQQDNS